MNMLADVPPGVTLDAARMPSHIAIIMDGNRRWAKEHRVPVIEGHRRGIVALREITRAASDWGIPLLTVYGFSSENWKRDSTEISLLLDLCVALIAAIATPAAKATPLTLTPAQLRQFEAAAALASGPKSPLALHAPWLTHGFAAIFVFSALLLIFLLAIQTTKQEGLGGTVGGKVESAYKGRVGIDKQLQRFTTAVAITFVLFATLVSLSGI